MASNRRHGAVRLLAAALALFAGWTPARGDAGAPTPATVVVLGATGDLTARMLVPALLELERAHALPAGTRVLGLAPPSPDIPDNSDAAFRRLIQDRVKQLAPSGWDATAWSRLAPALHFQPGDLADPKTFEALAARLAALEGAPSTHVFYLALPPKLIGPTVQRLQGAGLIGRGDRHVRVVVEKPIGVDLASARAINDDLERIVGEDRTYRMDHYLGKQNVRNLLKLRFADRRFQSIWNKHYIDRIEVSAHEKVGIEGRSAFYESVGAARDMVQSHLLQVLALATMDRPAGPGAAGVREAKIRLLESLRPLGPQEVARQVVRGQYRGGAAGGYRDQSGVAPDSVTETYVAMRVELPGRRWAGVPMHLVTGKALDEKRTEVRVHFRRLPAQLAASIGQAPEEPAILTIGIDPKPTLSLAGRPLALPPAAGPSLGPYARQLADVLAGDQALFLHRRETEAAWRFIDPIVAAWKQAGRNRLFPYRAGSTGPIRARTVLPRGSLDGSPPPDELAWARLRARERGTAGGRTRPMEPLRAQGPAIRHR